MFRWNLRACVSRRSITTRILLACTALLTVIVLSDKAHAQNQDRSQSDVAKPVRNGVAVPGEEVLVLRHQKLKKGSHDDFYELSKGGVWPWFEKIGTRVVGQWKVIHPDGSGGSDEYDEGYRLARYASYEHWEATRRGENLGGNGPDFEKSGEALRARGEMRLGSDGAYFLQGHMAPGGPYYLPGMDERYEPAPEDTVSDQESTNPIPIRNDVAQPGREIVTMRSWKIQKGRFDDFYKASVEGVWPFFEKIGARIIGQWKVIHPPADTREESPDYDEVILMTRYASYAHWEATRNPAQLGGNGPDYDKMREALALRRSLTLETSVKFMEGYMYHSPPNFMPGLKERYRLAE